MTGIDKSFPGVRALQQVDLELHAGEVLALVGENGAGKSTLMKILGGAIRPDRGLICIEGQPVQISSPQSAQTAGVAIIYQEFNLVPGLSAADNIFLGQERSQPGLPRLLSFVARRRERTEARRLFDRLGVAIDPAAICRRLTVAQQQIVEIAKALSQQARILVMDEPTAALTSGEVARLFEVIRELKAQGIGIIYISHRLEEVFEIADRVMVLRDGRHVGTARVSDVTRTRLIEMMVGRELSDEFPKRSVPVGRPRLVVRGLRRAGSVRDVSFHVCAGEVLALTGLVGSGRTETARLIFGADRPDAGEILLDGRPLTIRHPRDAINAGIGLLTEDRKLQGLVLNQSVRHNFSLPNLTWLARAGFVRPRLEAESFDRYARDLRIKLADPDQPVQNLSGGNQQKVVLAKWLARRCEILIFDEPTRGIDVGAKYEIYSLINQLAAEGKGVIMISSELPEVLGMADRILVMHEGRITGEITDVASATQQQILQLAVR
ncbi:MAG: sugar ABC transporter ATP-binding protein [Planctomycetes bacterium]|nr:sugar ABC transporter ATP-binding protein [Planctomycetota bacterium]